MPRTGSRSTPTRGSSLPAPGGTGRSPSPVTTASGPSTSRSMATGRSGPISQAGSIPRMRSRSRPMESSWPRGRRGSSASGPAIRSRPLRDRRDARRDVRRRRQSHHEVHPRRRLGERVAIQATGRSWLRQRGIQRRHLEVRSRAVPLERVPRLVVRRQRQGDDEVQQGVRLRARGGDPTRREDRGRGSHVGDIKGIDTKFASCPLPSRVVRQSRIDFDRPATAVGVFESWRAILKSRSRSLSPSNIRDTPTR